MLKQLGKRISPRAGVRRGQGQSVVEPLEAQVHSGHLPTLTGIFSLLSSVLQMEPKPPFPPGCLGCLSYSKCGAPRRREGWRGWPSPCRPRGPRSPNTVLTTVGGPGSTQLGLKTGPNRLKGTQDTSFVCFCLYYFSQSELGVCQLYDQVLSDTGWLSYCEAKHSLGALQMLPQGICIKIHCSGCSKD